VPSANRPYDTLTGDFDFALRPGSSNGTLVYSDNVSRVFARDQMERSGRCRFAGGQHSDAADYHGRALVSGESSDPAHPEQDTPINDDGRGDCLALGRNERSVFTLRLR
jgi:hypothetical protein